MVLVKQRVVPRSVGEIFQLNRLDMKSTTHLSTFRFFRSFSSSLLDPHTHTYVYIPAYTVHVYIFHWLTLFLSIDCPSIRPLVLSFSMWYHHHHHHYHEHHQLGNTKHHALHSYQIRILLWYVNKNKNKNKNHLLWRCAQRFLKIYDLSTQATYSCTEFRMQTPPPHIPRTGEFK